MYNRYWNSPCEVDLVEFQGFLGMLNLPEESWLDWVVGLQVDLISVDLTQRLPFRMKAAMVKAAIEVP
jgi:hypothetical protein